jgi:hypothetical protein
MRRLFNIRSAIVDGNVTLQSDTIQHFPTGPHSIDKAQRLSYTLRNMEPLEDNDIERVIRYWFKIGFLEPALDGRVEAKL